MYVYTSKCNCIQAVAALVPTAAGVGSEGEELSVRLSKTNSDFACCCLRFELYNETLRSPAITNVRYVRRGYTSVRRPTLICDCYYKVSLKRYPPLSKTRLRNATGNEISLTKSTNHQRNFVDFVNEISLPSQKGRNQRNFVQRMENQRNFVGRNRWNQRNFVDFVPFRWSKCYGTEYFVNEWNFRWTKSREDEICSGAHFWRWTKFRW